MAITTNCAPSGDHWRDSVRTRVKAADAEIADSGIARTVSGVIGTMPALRRGISRGLDDAAAWRGEIFDAAMLLAGIYKGRTIVRSVKRSCPFPDD